MKMKILTGVFVFLMLSGCRSSSTVNSAASSRVSSYRESSGSFVENDSVSAIISRSNTSDTEVYEYRVAYFPPAAGDTADKPAVQSESWIFKTTRDRSDLTAGMIKSASAKADYKSAETEDNKIDTAFSHDSHSDSRLLQGGDWFWFSIGVGAVLTIIIIVVWKKLRG
ncbi:MAG: hypothetical protein LBC40_05710 [Dysgonamonadaceae bacterium]|jgi:hypothetical protein|nr:hypothetical protein [Dysgonamonadaceae bacterium]